MEFPEKMKILSLGPGDCFRGVLAIGLIALGVGVVAPTSPVSAALMVVGAITLAASGPNQPVFRSAHGR